MNKVTVTFSALLIYQLSDLRALDLNRVTRISLLFLLITMMAERLLRGALMDGFVTTAWLYAFIATAPKLAPWLATACLVVGAAPFASSWWRRLLAALAIAVVAFLVVGSVVDRLYAPVLAAAAPLGHSAVYGFPYGWQVTTAAYITYIEPVLGCLIAAALVWPKLPKPLILRIATLALLIVMVRGSLLSPFAYATFHRDHWLAAFISDGQFSLESLVLGLLTALTWRFASASKIDSRATV